MYLFHSDTNRNCISVSLTFNGLAIERGRQQKLLQKKVNAFNGSKKSHHIKWENKKIVKNKNEKYEESLMLRTTRVERFLTIYESENRFGSQRLDLHSQRLDAFLSLYVCVSLFQPLQQVLFLGKIASPKELPLCCWAANSLFHSSPPLFAIH